MDEHERKLAERDARVRATHAETQQRSELLRSLRETLERDPTPQELAAAAAELHAAHARHQAEVGETARAEAAKERERRARERASR